MILRKLEGAFALALLVWTCSLTAALAHAFPGSVLTFSQTGNTVQLRIELALDDLIVASPQFDALADAQLGAVDDAALSSLNEYFADHLKVRTAANAALSLQLESGTLSLGKDHHAGTFQLLTVQISAQVGEDENVFPIHLTYDAVMHEVRNHRATVFWRQAGDTLLRLAEFGFARKDGKPASLVLDLD